MKQFNFSQDHGYGVSDRYKVINTEEILSQFESAGYSVRSVLKARVKNPQKEGFQKHLIRLNYPDVDLKIDGIRPELVLKNAYDGTSSFVLKIGVFRLICSNGLEVGTTFQQTRVRHVGNNVMEQVLQGANAIKEQFPIMAEQIKIMQKVQLSQSEAEQFANDIGHYLIGNRSDLVNTDFEKLLTAHRHGDNGTDLFTVLNKIQENALHGYYRYTVETPVLKGMTQGQKDYRTKSGRRIRSIDKTSQINTLIWDKALELVA